MSWHCRARRILDLDQEAASLANTHTLLKPYSLISDIETPQNYRKNTRTTHHVWQGVRRWVWPLVCLTTMRYLAHTERYFSLRALANIPRQEVMTSRYLKVRPTQRLRRCAVQERNNIEYGLEHIFVEMARKLTILIQQPSKRSSTKSSPPTLAAHQNLKAKTWPSPKTLATY